MGDVNPQKAYNEADQSVGAEECNLRETSESIRKEEDSGKKV